MGFLRAGLKPVAPNTPTPDYPYTPHGRALIDGCATLINRIAPRKDYAYTQLTGVHWIDGYASPHPVYAHKLSQRLVLQRIERTDDPTALRTRYVRVDFGGATAVMPQ